MSLPGTKDSFKSVWSVDGDYSFPQAGPAGTRKLAVLSWGGSVAQAKTEKIEREGKANPGISVTAVLLIV